jgi:hypothetical protein
MVIIPQYLKQNRLILEEVMNIHEYANELICIILLPFKERFMLSCDTRYAFLDQLSIQISLHKCLKHKSKM